MKLRRLAALIGGGILTLGLASSAFAAAPQFSIEVTKVASPTTLRAPVANPTWVTYWITVKNTTVTNGDGAFKIVNLSDASCSPITFHSSSDGSDPGSKNDNKLKLGEWWKFTCRVNAGGWSVGTHTNTVWVNACHDGSKAQCNNAKHDARDSASATVTVTVAAPTTSTLSSSSSGDSSLPWLAAILALAALIGLAVAPRVRRRIQ